ncbi:B12-binding domain-containing radical SAM protein [Cetobacterium somerae]|uniref:B12-binding domain-containing radical SAM protein n=1 Tax=Cetobacterium sp. NK01 TaxID=2993530 RepID=UPI002116BD10|nr:B12-binding domain-containing radical SAM protein [Cetobacterium sp. NK01]MCQ8211426.1 B12-binding domain-containing radical SAM protein [Cetobacterium sp. NK01]
MEKIVLVGINSQFIHTNLAIRYLKSYVEKYSDLKIDIYESNINNQIQSIMTDLFNLNADHYIFSTYIWNKEYVFRIIRELKKIMPNITITLGGPEVSYNAKESLLENTSIDFILVGEGEKVILNFLTNENKNQKGVASLEDNEYTYIGDENPIENLDVIPFPYSKDELKENIKILYYESSRGCPFSCSYCLSSIDKGVRYLSLDRVKSDLQKFLDSGVELLKFVDRTYNLKKDRYLGIWEYLLENYKEGITFHFEINANIFDEEVIEFLKKIPEGYFQFEIGVQSINKETMDSINRRNLLERLRTNIKAISKNIHLHVDLIAGLPYDTYESFKDSFDYVYDLESEMIQLGFLKILSGTKISREIEKYEYKYIEFPPYEVLSNCFIKYEELIKLKNIEKMLDYYYNSEKFKNSVKYIIENYYNRPFDFFEDISKYYYDNKLLGIGHKTVGIFNHLVKFFEKQKFDKIEIFIEYLKLDYLLLGKPGLYPEWFISHKNKDKYNDIIVGKKYSSVREGYKKTEFEKFSYDVIKNEKKEIEIFFDYSNKKIKIEIF